MKKLLCFSSLLACSFTISTNVHAFWDQSHQLIGEIASRRVTGKTSKEVDKLLNVKIGYPGSEELAKNTNSFDTAASWADDIKFYNNQPINQNLSLCHFSDIPLSKEMIGENINEDSALKKLEDVITKVPYNSVSCLKRSIKTLLTSSESELNKAIALRMVIHIVGDIGQPLHSSALTEGSFDDAGGNKIKLERVVSFANIDGTSSSQNNLHKLWDGVLGIYLQFPYNSEDSKRGIYTPEERQSTKYDATEILRSSNFESIDVTLAGDPNEKSIEKWVVDSYKIAVKSVYSDLILKAPTRSGNASMSALFSDSWKMYQANRIHIIDLQIKKSGIRLFHLLNSIFDSNSPKNQYSILVSSIKNDSDIKPLVVK
jgi:S1/P1 Nuclease